MRRADRTSDHRRNRFGSTLRSVVVAVGTVVVLSDWPARRTSGHWAGYPFFTSVISGLLLLLVTYLFVEWIIARQNTAKWSSVAHSGFKALAGAAEDVSDGLAELVVGTDDRSTSGVKTNLPPVLGQRAIELTTFSGPPNRSRRRDDHREPFLAALEANLQIGAWCDVAQRATHHLRESLRDKLAIWLAAMLTSTELARIANRVALLDRRLQNLQGPMLQLSRLHSGEFDVDDHGNGVDHYRDVVYRMMQAAFLETAALHETLSRLSDVDRTDYRHVAERLRNRLDARHLGWIESHNDQLMTLVDDPVVSDTFEGAYRNRLIVPPEPASWWSRASTRVARRLA